MATIKAIEAQSVHQIQSGQVIVDLCSVIKELVENGLDAGANSIEVRFKNNGLDSIEVQDNGTGVSAANYGSVALKHHTSKLSVYDDLSSLQTFGFRGEALSSLCALSTFCMITAQADEAPKGKRLGFETSGKLKSTTVVACQRGTTATVENLFESLPVRRKELSKNIKREYGKVIGLLHAYACICTGVRFIIKNVMPKGKSTTVFATNANASTRENIANVYGAKTLQALAPLELELEFHPSLTQLSGKDTHPAAIKVKGHISRPVWGEGRQTPDRQMFFVNGRPCGLPQVAKAMNEVYKSFNVSQSPFIFADFRMDTNAYDVNVSPDKRTILLHNATDLVEKLKETLNTLFERQDQTIPQSQVAAVRLPAFKQLRLQRTDSVESDTNIASYSRQKAHSDRSNDNDVSANDDHEHNEASIGNLLHDHFRAQTSTREQRTDNETGRGKLRLQKDKEKRAGRVAKTMAKQEEIASVVDAPEDLRNPRSIVGKKHVDSPDSEDEKAPIHEAGHIEVRDFNQCTAGLQMSHNNVRISPADESYTSQSVSELNVSTVHLEQQDHPNTVQEAFDHVRPQRAEAEVATITIGDRITNKLVGGGVSSLRSVHPGGQLTERQQKKQKVMSASTQQFSQGLRKFEAFRTQNPDTGSATEDQSLCRDEEVRSESSRSNGSDSSAIESARQKKVNKNDNDESDPDYVDPSEEKAEESARVAELIRLAEESAAKPNKWSLKRATIALKASTHKDSTADLLANLSVSLAILEAETALLQQATANSTTDIVKSEVETNTVSISDEDKLSLTVARTDFAEMDIIGQFNLGFVLAVHGGSNTSQQVASEPAVVLRDELFIIDQHASDEKYNFERLQAITVVSNQRLVHPIMLDLTAVEEEIVLENLPALEKNGFIVEVDISGSSPIGQRCRLLTLPLSKEVTFNTRDLDELIHLLAESPVLNEDSQVPRPTKVRKMFAMRACRSSIMIGKTLSKRQMGDVLRHMGEIEKPWNCPHGRPTMRHLTSLDVLGVWKEGDGMAGQSRRDGLEVWMQYGKV